MILEIIIDLEFYTIDYWKNIYEKFSFFLNTTFLVNFNIYILRYYI